MRNYMSPHTRRSRDITEFPLCVPAARTEDIWASLYWSLKKRKTVGKPKNMTLHYAASKA